VFITTPEFLDQHRQHREQTRRLLATASTNGQLRLVEMNQQVLTNSDQIIGTLEVDDGEMEDGQGVADAG
jgi:hypothetical protein